MNRMILQYMLLFLVLEALDIFLISVLQIHGYFLPHIAPLFILLLPVRTSRSLLLTLGFITGLTMDMFLNTGGLFAASVTLVAFLRIFLLPFFTTPEDYDNNHSPNLAHLGGGGFLLYSASLLLIFHLVYFLLELFEWRMVHILLLRTVISTLGSLLLIYLHQIVTAPKKKKANARSVR